MELQFISDGGRLGLHPDSEAKVLSLSPWQRHAVFHMTCQQVYASQHQDQHDGANQLTANGFATISECLTKGEASRISTAITEVLEQQGPDSGAHKPISDDAKGTLVTVPQESSLLEALREALPKILNPRVEAELYAYYGCHFRVYSGITYRTHAVTDHANSFLWHRDMAPMSQVHLMLYLTDSGEDDGATMVLDLHHSRRAASLGYHYENMDKRIFDIGQVFADVDEEPIVRCPDVKSGDSLMFAAARVLHRGSLPTRGYRDTFTLVLLPSTVPWQQDIEDLSDDHVFDGTSRATLLTNPFQPRSPLIEAEVGLGGR